MKDLSNRKIGVIHASLISSKAVQPFIEDVIPEVKVLHHVEDTIQESNFACQPGVIPKANFLKFANAAYKLQEAGAEGTVVVAHGGGGRCVGHGGLRGGEGAEVDATAVPIANWQF